MTPPQPIYGIQMSPISMLHEGVEHVYRLLRDEAGLNAVFTYCNTYQICRWARHQEGKLAADHGVDPPDFDYCDTRNTWFDPDPRYYGQSPFISSEDEGKLFTDRDVFTEQLEKADEYGFQVFARALEAEHGIDCIPGWAQVCTIDCYGQTTNRPCPNNPGYQAFWVAIVEDLFQSYPNLAGFKFGAERPGPLSLAMFNGKGHWYYGMFPDCFCPYCQERMTQRGIDVDRARDGYRKLSEYTRGLQEGSGDLRDGAFVRCFRILMEYPEIFAHNRLFLSGLEELHARLSGVIHRIKPSALFGLHIYQGATAWDFLHRAAVDFRDMARYVDFLKPVIYQTIAGARMIDYLDSIKEGVFADMGPEFALEFLYKVQGFQGPPHGEVKQKGFSVDYVYRETRRCVEGLDGRALTLAGPGFDIGGANSPDEPDRVYETVRACLDAGADGLIVSREYDEMKRRNLQAVGRALGK